MPFDSLRLQGPFYSVSAPPVTVISGHRGLLERMTSQDIFSQLVQPSIVHI